eukprot:816921-Pelagomonas_calceolata.AAC.7
MHQRFCAQNSAGIQSLSLIADPTSDAQQVIHNVAQIQGCIVRQSSPALQGDSHSSAQEGTTLPALSGDSHCSVQEGTTLPALSGDSHCNCTRGHDSTCSVEQFALQFHMPQTFQSLNLQ